MPWLTFPPVSVVNGDTRERPRRGSDRSSCEDVSRGSCILWFAAFVTKDGPKVDGDEEHKAHDVHKGEVDGPPDSCAGAVRSMSSVGLCVLSSRGESMYALVDPNLRPSSRGLEGPWEVTLLLSCKQRVSGACREF